MQGRTLSLLAAGFLGLTSMAVAYADAATDPMMPTDPAAYPQPMCSINVTASQAVSNFGGAVFNAQSASQPASVYSSYGPVANFTVFVSVPCNDDYYLSATPIMEPSIMSLMVSEYEFTANPVHLSETGSVSAVYPYDFPAAPQDQAYLNMLPGAVPPMI